MCWLSGFPFSCHSPSWVLLIIGILLKIYVVLLIPAYKDAEHYCWYQESDRYNGLFLQFWSFMQVQTYTVFPHSLPNFCLSGQGHFFNISVTLSLLQEKKKLSHWKLKPRVNLIIIGSTAFSDISPQFRVPGRKSGEKKQTTLMYWPFDTRDSITRECGVIYALKFH